MCTRHLPSGVSGRLLAGALGILVPALAAAQPTTTRVSVATGGDQGNDESFGGVISADGRWVAFASGASNLVPGDTNGEHDVFVYDRQSGSTTRVSVGQGGVQGNGASRFPSLSGDGRWVAFMSWASTLVPGDTNEAWDVFVHDRHSGATTRVSVGPDGVQGNAHSEYPSMSADGRWVTFESDASNLVRGDTNGTEEVFGQDVFVHDRQTGTTTRVSVGARGTPANILSQRPSISADGRWVVFNTGASNLVPGDSGINDVFVHDRQTATTSKVSAGPGGVEGNHFSFNHSDVISADGRYAVFGSQASNLVPDDTNGLFDVFLQDRQTGSPLRVSVGPSGAEANGSSGGGAISADGHWVAFISSATNLVPGDTNGQQDIFVFDRHTQTTTLVSGGPGGTQGNGPSYAEALSPTGRYVVFTSSATNLVDGDTNGKDDVFVHDRGDLGCAVVLAPPSATVLGTGAERRALVLAPAGCAWTAVSNAPDWLAVTAGASGAGFGVVEFTTAQNTGTSRTGTITIGDQVLTVDQAAAGTPGAPGELFVQSLAGNIVTLRWATPSEGPAPTGYVLEGGIQPGDALVSVPVGTLPTFTFEAPTGSFYARVYAVNGAVRSMASNEVRFHVNAPLAPSAPAHLLGVVDGSTVSFAWTNTYEGGAPASLELSVDVPPYTPIPLGLVDHVTFAGVPPGTYLVAVRARNAWATSERSNHFALTVPGPCTGPPLAPIDVLAYSAGQRVTVNWSPDPVGPAPTAYVVIATGSAVDAVVTTERAVSRSVAPGTYTLRVFALNPCGISAATTPQTIVVP